LPRFYTSSKRKSNVAAETDLGPEAEPQRLGLKDNNMNDKINFTAIEYGEAEMMIEDLDPSRTRRDLHWNYSYFVLPRIVNSDPNIFNFVQSPEANEFLIQLWNSTRSITEEMTEYDDIAPQPLVAEPTEVAGCSAVLITFPEAIEATEAIYALLVKNLERNACDTSFLPG
jgi:hypothetical protein